MLLDSLQDSHRARFSLVRSFCESYLPHIPVIHPGFTLHDQRHSSAVVDVLDRFLTALVDAGTIGRPNSAEAYRLILSAYLHDSGMLYLRNGERHTTGAADLSSRVRADHEIRSVEFIDEYVTDDFLTPAERADVKVICRSHRGRQLSTEPTLMKPSHDSQIPTSPVRLDLLSAALRLCDELDLTAVRAPVSLFRILLGNGMLPPDALVHWVRHSYVRSVTFQTTQDTTGVVTCMVNVAVFSPTREYFEWIAPTILRGYWKEVEDLNQIFARYRVRVVLGEVSRIDSEVFQLDEPAIVGLNDQVRIALVDDVETMKSDVEAALDEADLLGCVTVDYYESADDVDDYSRYHVVLLDVILGDDIGYDHIERIRRENPVCQIVLVSETNSASDVVGRGIKAGANDFFYKLADDWIEALKTILSESIRKAFYARVAPSAVP